MEDELKELHFRRNIALAAIRQIAGTKDPRAQEAEAFYREQLADIDKRITEITGTPPPVVVGLQAATITARRA